MALDANIELIINGFISEPVSGVGADYLLVNGKIDELRVRELKAQMIKKYGEIAEFTPNQINEVVVNVKNATPSHDKSSKALESVLIQALDLAIASVASQTKGVQKRDPSRTQSEPDIRVAAQAQLPLEQKGTVTQDVPKQEIQSKVSVTTKKKIKKKKAQKQLKVRQVTLPEHHEITPSKKGFEDLGKTVYTYRDKKPLTRKEIEKGELISSPSVLGEHISVSERPRAQSAAMTQSTSPISQSAVESKDLEASVISNRSKIAEAKKELAAYQAIMKGSLTGQAAMLRKAQQQSALPHFSRALAAFNTAGSQPEGFSSEELAILWKDKGAGIENIDGFVFALAKSYGIGKFGAVLQKQEKYFSELKTIFQELVPIYGERVINELRTEFGSDFSTEALSKIVGRLSNSKPPLSKEFSQRLGYLAEYPALVKKSEEEEFVKIRDQLINVVESILTGGTSVSALIISNLFVKLRELKCEDLFLFVHGDPTNFLDLMQGKVPDEEFLFFANTVYAGKYFNAQSLLKEITNLDGTSEQDNLRIFSIIRRALNENLEQKVENQWKNLFATNPLLRQELINNIHLFEGRTGVSNDFSHNLITIYTVAYQVERQQYSRSGAADPTNINFIVEFLEAELKYNRNNLDRTLIYLVLASHYAETDPKAAISYLLHPTHRFHQDGKAKYQQVSEKAASICSLTLKGWIQLAGFVANSSLDDVSEYCWGYLIDNAKESKFDQKDMVKFFNDIAFAWSQPLPSDLKTRKNVENSRYEALIQLLTADVFKPYLKLLTTTPKDNPLAYRIFNEYGAKRDKRLGTNSVFEVMVASGLDISDKTILDQAHSILTSEENENKQQRHDILHSYFSVGLIENSFRDFLNKYGTNNQVMSFILEREDLASLFSGTCFRFPDALRDSILQLQKEIFNELAKLPVGGGETKQVTDIDLNSGQATVVKNKLLLSIKITGLLEQFSSKAGNTEIFALLAAQSCIITAYETVLQDKLIESAVDKANEYLAKVDLTTLKEEDKKNFLLNILAIAHGPGSENIWKTVIAKEGASINAAFINDLLKKIFSDQINRVLAPDVIATVAQALFTLPKLHSLIPEIEPSLLARLGFSVGHLAIPDVQTEEKLGFERSASGPLPEVPVIEIDPSTFAFALYDAIKGQQSQFDQFLRATFPDKGINGTPNFTQKLFFKRLEKDNLLSVIAGVAERADIIFRLVLAFPQSTVLALALQKAEIVPESVKKVRIYGDEYALDSLVSTLGIDKSLAICLTHDEPYLLIAAVLRNPKFVDVLDQKEQLNGLLRKISAADMLNVFRNLRDESSKIILAKNCLLKASTFGFNYVQIQELISVIPSSELYKVYTEQTSKSVKEKISDALVKDLDRLKRRNSFTVDVARDFGGSLVSGRAAFAKLFFSMFKETATAAAQMLIEFRLTGDELVELINYFAGRGDLDTHMGRPIVDYIVDAIKSNETLQAQFVEISEATVLSDQTSQLLLSSFKGLTTEEAIAARERIAFLAISNPIIFVPRNIIEQKETKYEQEKSYAETEVQAVADQLQLVIADLKDSTLLAAFNELFKSENASPAAKLKQHSFLKALFSAKENNTAYIRGFFDGLKGDLRNAVFTYCKTNLESIPDQLQTIVYNFITEIDGLNEKTVQFATETFLRPVIEEILEKKKSILQDPKSNEQYIKESLLVVQSPNALQQLSLSYQQFNDMLAIATASTHPEQQAARQLQLIKSLYGSVLSRAKNNKESVRQAVQHLVGFMNEGYEKSKATMAAFMSPEFSQLMAELGITFTHKDLIAQQLQHIADTATDTDEFRIKLLSLSSGQLLKLIELYKPKNNQLAEKLIYAMLKNKEHAEFLVFPNQDTLSKALEGIKLTFVNLVSAVNSDVINDRLLAKTILNFALSSQQVKVAPTDGTAIASKIKQFLGELSTDDISNLSDAALDVIFAEPAQIALIRKLLDSQKLSSAAVTRFNAYFATEQRTLIPLVKALNDLPPAEIQKIFQLVDLNQLADAATAAVAPKVAIQLIELADKFNLKNKEAALMRTAVSTPDNTINREILGSRHTIHLLVNNWRNYMIEDSPGCWGLSKPQKLLFLKSFLLNDSIMRSLRVTDHLPMLELATQCGTAADYLVMLKLCPSKLKHRFVQETIAPFLTQYNEVDDPQVLQKVVNIFLKYKGTELNSLLEKCENNRIKMASVKDALVCGVLSNTSSLLWIAAQGSQQAKQVISDTCATDAVSAALFEGALAQTYREPPSNWQHRGRVAAIFESNALIAKKPEIEKKSDIEKETDIVKKIKIFNTFKDGYQRDKARYDTSGVAWYSRWANQFVEWVRTKFKTYTPGQYFRAQLASSPGSQEVMRITHGYGGSVVTSYSKSLSKINQHAALLDSDKSVDDALIPVPVVDDIKERSADRRKVGSSDGASKSMQRESAMKAVAELPKTVLTFLERDITEITRLMSFAQADKDKPRERSYEEKVWIAAEAATDAVIGQIPGVETGQILRSTQQREAKTEQDQKWFAEYKKEFIDKRGKFFEAYKQELHDFMLVIKSWNVETLKTDPAMLGKFLQEIESRFENLKIKYQALAAGTVGQRLEDSSIKPADIFKALSCNKGIPKKIKSAVDRINACGLSKPIEPAPSPTMTL